MIDAKTGIAAKGITKILPECVDAFARMQLPQSVGPALRDEETIGLSHLGAKQGVIHPALGCVNVEIDRHDIVVACEHDRPTAGMQAFCTVRQSVEQAQLLVELGSGGRIAVRQIDAANCQTVGRRFDIAAMHVVGVSG